MQAPDVQSDDLSQDSDSYPLHRKPVTKAVATYDDPASKRSRGMFDQLSMTSVGLEFGIAVVLGLLFGRWLDGQLGTDPWMLVLFTIFGFAAGVKGIAHAVRKADRAAEREAAKQVAHG